MAVGAGTVTSTALAELAHSAGAQFIVSPDTDPAVIRRTKELGMCAMPGAMTPSEIKTAYEAGADFVKVFPASVLGPEYIRAIRGPLGQIPLLSVGGVSEGNAAAFLQACRAAKAHGLTVSCDLNFRKKLWTSEQANAVMSKLLPYVDVCIANEEDAKDVFGICAENTDVTAGKLDQAGYRSVAAQLCARFGCGTVAITLRGSRSASDNDWSAMLYTGGEAFFSPTYHMHIVDRVGGGDSFGGALIYALLKDYESQEAINYAVAASCLKHSIEQDFNLISDAEAASLAAGNTTGRVQR